MSTRLVKIERVHGSTKILLIDEIDRFVAEVEDIDFSCEIWDGGDTFEEDGEVWYRCHKNKLDEYKKKL